MSDESNQIRSEDVDAMGELMCFMPPEDVDQLEDRTAIENVLLTMSNFNHCPAMSADTFDNLCERVSTLFEADG